VSYPCPKCHDPNTRSLPMVFQRGIGYVQLNGMSIKYAPPKRRGMGWWIAGLLLLTPVPFVLADMLRLPNSLGAIVQFIFVILIWAAIMAWGLRSAIRYNKTEWPELARRWNASFLCMACGTIFQPTKPN